MYKTILETANVDWFGLASTVVFFAVFVLVVVLIIRAKKSHVDHMSNLPLED